MKIPELDKNRRLSGPARTEIAQALLDEYNGGKSVRQIRDDTGYSIGRVRRLLIEAGVQFRERGGSHRPTARTKRRTDGASSDKP